MLNYSSFQSFDFERNWLFQNRVVHNKFDIFVFIFKRQTEISDFWYIVLLANIPVSYCEVLLTVLR